MSTTPLRVLLFAAGVLIAGTGTAYFAGALDPVAGPIAETLLPGAQQPEGGSAEADAQQGQGAGTPSAGIAEGTGSAGARGKVVVPSFDLLRAEPDGSLVVAGRAAPGAEVQVLSGSSVLATTKAGPTGDFAAVVDDALEPGEHNIVLRGTAPDNLAATSLETAIVSVPSDEGGQVVALVQQPGEPSRLISAPVPEEPGDADEGQPADAEGAPETRPPADTETAEASGSQEQAAETVPGEEPGSEPAMTVEAMPGDAAATPPSGPVAEAPGEPAAADTAQEVAETPPQEGQETQPAVDTPPFIEAVEIDGREVFVAGSATPGRKVNVYANDILLGQATVSPDGRFLVEAERDLPVGDYIIRADVLDDDGVTVVARAAVPFERHTGENIAALAPEAAARLQPPQSGADSNGPAQRTSQPPSAVEAADEQQEPGAAAGEKEAAAPDARTDTITDSRAPAVPEASPPPDAGKTSSETTATPPQATASSDAGQPAKAPAAGSSTATANIEVVSPPLQAIDGAVIIRRGDTLWHISRRVYGRGMRYTTIYLANQDQISNPDLIWPGQTFVVPEETGEGEKADLDAIGDQAVPPADAASRVN